MSTKDYGKISIVMAAFNAEEFIAEAIQSVLNQSYSNIELVIVNDGSTDRTAEVIETFKTDGRLIYIFQENAGQTLAKNRGIKKSTGVAIGFCDADDAWDRRKLDIQLPQLFSKDEIGVVYSNVQCMDESGNFIKTDHESPPVYQGDLTDKLLYDNCIPFGTTVIKRKCIESVSGFNEDYRMGIDWDLWLRISVKWKFAGVPDRLYFYREWGGQMSRNYDGRYNSALVILSNFVKENKSVVNRKEFRHAVAEIYAGYTYHISLYEGYNLRLLKYFFLAMFRGFDRPSVPRRLYRAIMRRF